MLKLRPQNRALFEFAKLNATRNEQTDERVRKESRRRSDQAKSSLIVIVSSFSPPITAVYQTQSLFWTHLSSWSTERSSSISSQASATTRLVRVSRQFDDPFVHTHRFQNTIQLNYSARLSIFIKLQISKLRVGLYRRIDEITFRHTDYFGFRYTRILSFFFFFFFLLRLRRKARNDLPIYRQSIPSGSQTFQQSNARLKTVSRISLTRF